MACSMSRDGIPAALPRERRSTARGNRPGPARQTGAARSPERMTRTVALDPNGREHYAIGSLAGMLNPSAHCFRHILAGIFLRAHSFGHILAGTWSHRIHDANGLVDDVTHDHIVTLHAQKDQRPEFSTSLKTFFTETVSACCAAEWIGVRSLALDGFFWVRSRAVYRARRGGPNGRVSPFAQYSSRLHQCT